jgi:hypothetical protein
MPEPPVAKTPATKGEDPLVLARIEMQASDMVCTLPEWLVYKWLERHGLKADQDFFFQSSMYGGSTQYGGVIADFVLPGLIGSQGLVFRVQGLYWHYSKEDQKYHDLETRLHLEAGGWVVVDLDEDAIYERLESIMPDALKGIDHSRYTTGAAA